MEGWFDFWLSSGEGEAPSQLLLSANHDGADDDELLFKLKSSTCNLYLFVDIDKKGESVFLL